MIFDIIRAILQTTVALRYIGNKQVLHQTLCILIEVPGELDLTLEDLLINCHRVIVVERVNSCYHLVSQNAERPPIDRLTMSLIQ